MYYVVVFLMVKYDPLDATIKIVCPVLQEFSYHKLLQCSVAPFLLKYVV